MANNELATLFNEFCKINIGDRYDEISDIVDLENEMNIKFPDSLRKLLNIISRENSLKFAEWVPVRSEELYISRKVDTDKNLFEQLIIYDQNDKKGTSLIEVFTNSILLGYLKNGDRYYVNINVSRNNRVEVVYMNNYTGKYEFLFADSIESFIMVNTVLTKVMDEDSGIDDIVSYAKKYMEIMESKLNLPVQFKKLTEISGIEPVYKSYFPEAVYLFYRSLWIVHLLKCTNISEVDDVVEIFNIIDRKSINTSEDHIKSINEKTPTFKVIYWLWYLFFFKKDKALEDMMEALKVIESPLVNDTVTLVRELANGRKELGKIKDIQSIRDRFLQLNLDPEKDDKKSQGQNKLKRLSKNDDSSDINKQKEELSGTKKSDIIVNNIDVKMIPEISWDYIEEKDTIENLYDYLRVNEKSLNHDFQRYDYIFENHEDKNEDAYRVEYKEILDVLMLNRTKIAPLLYANGKYDFGEDYIKRKVLWFILNQKFDELDTFINSIGLEYYPAIYSPEFEEKIIRKLPNPRKDNILADNNFGMSINQLIPLLTKMKSKKAISYIIAYIDYYKDKMNGNEEVKDVAKDSFLNVLGPMFIRCIAKIKDSSLIPYVREYIGTKIEMDAIIALIELGDKEVVEILKDINTRQTGVIEKTIFTRFIYEYAKFKNNMSPDMELVKLSLFVLLDDYEKMIYMINKALEIISELLTRDEALSYLLLFVDFEYSKVRENTIKLLSNINDDNNLMYLDVINLKNLFKKNRKDYVVKLLTNSYAIYKHNIIRKFFDNDDKINGYESEIIKYLKYLTRFRYYSGDNIKEDYPVLSETILAAARLKNNKVDDFLGNLYWYKGELYKNIMDIEKYELDISDYLKTILTKPSYKINIKEDKGLKLYKESIGNKLWSFGTRVNGISVNQTNGQLVSVGQNKATIFNEDGELINSIYGIGYALDVDYSRNCEIIGVTFNSGNFHIYNARSLEKLYDVNIDKQENSAVKAIRFSCDDTKVATVYENSIRIWDANGYNMISKIEFDSEIYSVDWLPDSKRIIVGAQNKVYLVDINDKKTINSLNVSAESVRVGIKEDNDYLIAVGGNNITIINSEFKKIKELEQKCVSRIMFTKDCRHIYASSWAGDIGIKCWNMDDYSCEQLKEHKIIPIYALAINEVNGLIYAGGNSTDINCWAKDHQGIINVCVEHMAEVSAMTYSKKYSSVISASHDGTSIMWFSNRNGLVLYNNDGFKRIESMAISENERYIAYGMENIIVKNDTLTGKNEKIETDGHCYGMVPLNDNCILAVVGDTLHFIGNGRKEKMDFSIDNIAIIRNKEQLVLSGKEDKVFLIYDLGTNKIINTIKLPTEYEGIYSFDVSSDGKYVYVSCADNSIRIYDTTDWKIYKEIMLRFLPLKVVLTYDNSKMIVSSSNYIEIYDNNHFKKIGYTNFDSEISSILTLSNNSIVIGHTNGKLVSVRF